MRGTLKKTFREPRPLPSVVSVRDGWFRAVTRYAESVVSLGVPVPTAAAGGYVIW